MYFSSTFRRKDEAYSLSYPTFTFNTYDDWKLIPTSRPVINPPQPKVTSIEVPGANGSEDLSASLTGYPVFMNRTGSNKYLVEPDSYDRWLDIYTEVMNRIDGQYLKMYFEDEEPEFYYEGTWTVNTWNTGDIYSEIEIGYDLYPYKMKIGYAGDDCYWDNFNFENDYVVAPVSGTPDYLYVSLSNGESKPLINSWGAPFNRNTIGAFGQMPQNPQFRLIASPPPGDTEHLTTTVEISMINTDLGYDGSGAPGHENVCRVTAVAYTTGEWQEFPELVMTMLNPQITSLTSHDPKTHLMFSAKNTGTTGVNVTVEMRYKIGRL